MFKSIKTNIFITVMVLFLIGISIRETAATCEEVSASTDEQRCAMQQKH